MSALVDPEPYEHYRESQIGFALMETIDDLVSSNRIFPQLAFAIMHHFDCVIADTLANGKFDCNIHIKGELHTYNEVDEVYKFMVKSATLKLGPGWKATQRQWDQVRQIDRLAIVACRAKKPSDYGPGKGCIKDGLVKE